MPGAAAPGPTIIYTLTFSNAGNAAASGVVITDHVPISLTVQSVVSDCDVGLTQTVGGNSYTWNVAELGVGQGGVITITAVLSDPLAAGTFTNTATIASGDTIARAGTDLDGTNNSSSAAFVTVHAAAYLPLAARGYVGAPDLAVRDVIATSNDVQVVVENTGDRAVTADFWVDAYVDPDPAPAAVNQLWYTLADEGLVWGVTVDLLPGGAILPGDAITLTVDDAYYVEARSDVSWPLPVGTVVYAQVDSWNGETNYGAVLEPHEITGGPYQNNIASTISVAADAPSADEG